MTTNKHKIIDVMMTNLSYHVTSSGSPLHRRNDLIHIVAYRPIGSKLISEGTGQKWSSTSGYYARMKSSRENPLFRYIVW